MMNDDCGWLRIPQVTSSNEQRLAGWLACRNIHAFGQALPVNLKSANV